MRQSSAFRMLAVAALLLARLVATGAVATPRPASLDAPTIYLPLLAAVPPTFSVFGATISPGYVGNSLALAQSAHVDWVRYGAIPWSRIEPVPGQRDWALLDGMDAELSALSSQGFTPMVVIYGTPPWAQQIPGTECGPIKPEALDEFGDFVDELVRRYSTSPYNVHHWEIWNEPDVDPSRIAPTEGLGCWGDASDPYYGGGSYAEMLKRIYPVIKTADPQAQVLLGGLLLDCDPEHPPAGTSCASGRFLEGVLRNGGAAAFDILAYHGYAYWSEQRIDWDLNNDAWHQRGGVVLGKLAFLRETLARYGVDKPIMLNEASLLCVATCDEQQLAADQASYVVRLYSRALANTLVGAVWFTFEGPGWRNAGLLDGAQQPRPAYYAFQFLAAQLHDVRHVTSTVQGALEQHVFQRDSVIYTICWTNDSSTVPVPVPANVYATYDTLGRSITPTSRVITVGFEPIVIESIVETSGT